MTGVPDVPVLPLLPTSIEVLGFALVIAQKWGRSSAAEGKYSASSDSWVGDRGFIARTDYDTPEGLALVRGAVPASMMD